MLLTFIPSLSKSALSICYNIRKTFVLRMAETLPYSLAHGLACDELVHSSHKPCVTAAWRAA